jgi:hypothetical protein
LSDLGPAAGLPFIFNFWILINQVIFVLEAHYADIADPNKIEIQVTIIPIISSLI